MAEIIQTLVIMVLVQSIIQQTQALNCCFSCILHIRRPIMQQSTLIRPSACALGGSPLIQP